ncbi:hypothetical protein [Nocardia puris]|uniref:Uncharacterized protein n=1 Tax=Nocardia puris TaxID=208602 RepID=A0A366DMK9_9NOCA|nr:hypothetical protein [Nocardia puris]RBO91337.1 hypothetical protein DFR74_10439 [Nocardia puris]
MDTDFDSFDPGRDPDAIAERVRRTAAAQTAPAFRSWLERGDAEMQTLFDSVPEIAVLENSRWGVEGLRALERHLRSRFANVTELRGSPSGIYERFIGEVYRRSFDGEWRNFPDFARGGAEFWPVVELSYRPDHLDPHDLITTGVRPGTRRNPLHPEGELAWVYENFARDHQWWIDAGRPSREEWDQVLMKRILGRE